MSNVIYEQESYRIIEVCFEVHKQLGSGFLESVYHEALEIEFRNKKIPFTREQEINIFYKGYKLKKHYYADFICFNKIILEIKAVEILSDEHKCQILNYLKATGYKLGILLNFGEKSLQYKRLVL
jgi:GxxExxY protein